MKNAQQPLISQILVIQHKAMILNQMPSIGIFYTQGQVRNQLNFTLNKNIKDLFFRKNGRKTSSRTIDIPTSVELFVRQIPDII